MQYLPLVRMVAARIAARLPRLVDLDDLIQEGTLGLRVNVSLVAPHTIQRSEGKAKRVIDRRAE